MAVQYGEHRRQRARHTKYALCILFVFAGAAFFNVGHAVDGFVPKHVAVGYETVTSGSLPENNLVSQIPGFYSIVAILLAVLDVRPMLLLHFPIQFLPYTAVFFALVYVVSNGNAVLAGLLAGLELFLNSSATMRLFLWPHGIGFILFFTISIGLLVLFQKKRPYHVLPLLLLCSVALVHTSYNLTAIYLFVMVSSYALVRSHDLILRTFMNISESVKKNGVKSVILTATAVTGLFLLSTEFFWNTFLPLFSGEGKEGTLNTFISVWIGGGDRTGPSPVAHLLVTPPDSIRYIAMFRYLLVVTGLALFSLYVLYKLRERETLVSIDVLLAAYVSALVMYFFVRLYIGSVTIALFYLPGVLSIAYLYSTVDNRKISALAVVLLLLITGSVAATQVENNRHGLIDRNLDAAYHVDNEQEWIERYTAADMEKLSPEFNRNLLTFSSMLDQETPSYRRTSENYGLIDEEQVAALTMFEDPTGVSYFVLNSREESMSLQNWQIIESWDHHIQSVNDNPHANKIYTEGEAWIYTG